MIYGQELIEIWLNAPINRRKVCARILGLSMEQMERYIAKLMAELTKRSES